MMVHPRVIALIAVLLCLVFPLPPRMGQRMKRSCSTTTTGRPILTDRSK